MVVRINVKAKTCDKEFVVPVLVNMGYEARGRK